MKKILLLSVFATLCINAMETVSPADVIRGYMANPLVVLEQLKGFEQDELVRYRDSRHNNLIHIAVQKLMAHKEDFEDVPEGSQALIQYLVSCGVSINEVNDLREEPLYLACDYTYELGYVLEGLGARSIYFSLAPEIRAAKKWVAYFHSCEYFRKRKKD